MTLPGVGPITWSGFEHRWLFLFALVPLALLVLYVVAQIRRRQRLARFIGAAPGRKTTVSRQLRWRHVPIALTLIGLVLLTVALAGPTRDVRIPRNRAVIMLVVDVSQSMNATDVEPTRLAAAQKAAKQFAAHLTPGINLGLIAFAGNSNLLVAPNPNHQDTITALDKLQTADKTATGEAIFTALQSIDTVGVVLSNDGNTPPPPARIVLLSDGDENVPSNPDNPRGAYTAARSAKDQGVPISTIAFGTKDGYVDLNDQRLPVPVGTDTMTKIAELSGGQTYTATSVDELNRDYESVQAQIGYQVLPGPAADGWLRLAVFAATAAAILGLAINRRLPA
ncbi:VWA domain-containing protein [Mycolicibacterium madagascariense]|uniref:VWA domain-containing protein n=1 Tax=Mycolicibacterium madagascariense TaxID=212765 RepID=UPI0013D841D3|nr:VWA domain-containing protein [Mycolicibacterium madagascariense]MCV7015380.1 VWA domain-containing protein [Mycolicibacterium madagascariense]